MTRRFFVDAGLVTSDRFEIEGPLAHRLATVLRLRAGEEIILFDGSGEDARIRLDAVNGKHVSATVIERTPGPAEPRTKVHLYQSITKGERFEWLLEKATEIGVTAVTPLLTARSVVKPPSGSNRAERWRRIVVEAAEQCERSAIPALGESTSLDDVLSAGSSVVLLPYEDAGNAAESVTEVLARRIDDVFALAEVSILIGPEGGYEPEEVERAKTAGAEIVTLGTRVLRSETAGLVAVTLAMQALGELG
jgi:16S rRNA (uracil1498-N3)-methyltransferase